MSPLNRLALLLPLLCMAAAPSRADEPDDEIVVTGTTLSPAQARREATAFVAGVGVAAGQTPAARWIDPVCPRVFGIDRARAGEVEAQLRLIAADVGAKLARPRCTPNLTVIFTADAGGMVRRLVAQASATLSEIAPTDRARLLTGDAPVRWWYDTETRGKDGQRDIAMPFMAAGTGEGGASVLPSNGSSGSYLHYRSSLISTLSVRSIRSATIVVDVERAEGVTLSSLGAYAALVGLAEVRRLDAAPSGSILALFDKGGSVSGLTDRDLAFLRVLYAMPLDRLARQHRQMLVGRMLKPAKD